MPRSKTETCLLCDQVPCECGSTKRSKPVIKVASAPPVEQGPTPAQIAMQAQLAKQRREAQAKRFTPPSHRTVGRVDSGEALLSLALRALEPIMHDESKEKYRAILTAPPTLDERSTSWRARRDDN